MEAEFALKFAEEWQAAWNSHDVERILIHYADDVVFQSPYVASRFRNPPARCTCCPAGVLRDPRTGCQARVQAPEWHEGIGIAKRVRVLVSGQHGVTPS